MLAIIINDSVTIIPRCINKSYIKLQLHALRMRLFHLLIKRKWGGARDGRKRHVLDACLHVGETISD